MKSKGELSARRSEIQIRYEWNRAVPGKCRRNRYSPRDNEEKRSTSFLKVSRRTSSSTILALFRLEDSRVASWRVHIYIYIYIVESPRGIKPALQPELASRIAVPFNRIKVNATSSPLPPSLSLSQSPFIPCLQIEHRIKSALSDLILSLFDRMVEILLVSTIHVRSIN